jgi:heat-inducible transcriptional repressor
MSATLSPRREAILNLIIGEYVATAAPVASATIARRHQLGVSPATIRNEMAILEEEGYITHPHTSAGRVPSDHGYRYYVERLMEEARLPLPEQRTIRHQFHQTQWELEEWSRLAAAVLARVVDNVAVITLPRAPESRFRHLELVQLQDFMALLLLILHEAQLKRQVLILDTPTSQEDLRNIAHRLSNAFSGLSWNGIKTHPAELSSIEKEITAQVVQLMQAEDEQRYEDYYLEGMRNILSQPEFSSSDKMLQIVDVLEDKSVLGSLLPMDEQEEGIKVVIGGEHQQPAMRECSLVITRYGIPGMAWGAIGVLGPTRMRYGRAISAVRFIASLMGDFLSRYR